MTYGDSLYVYGTYYGGGLIGYTNGSNESYKDVYIG